MATSPIGLASPAEAATRCRLITLAWTGAEVETRAELAWLDNRLYLRLPAWSPALERVWNRPHVRVLPAGRAATPAFEGEARVVPGAADDDVLYVELVPSA